jgi:hypothetical protein
MNIRSLLGAFSVFSLIFSLILPISAHAQMHEPGTNIRDANGVIYRINGSGSTMQRMPFTSAAAFLSYGYNAWITVQPASPEDLNIPID